MIKIYELKEINEETVNAFANFIPQLAPDIKVPTMSELKAIVSSPGSTLFVAEDKEIIGAITLINYRIPSGIKVWIEDLVVEKNARGKGVGEALILYAISHARKLGFSKIDLTSSLHRHKAKGLYQKLGFVKRSSRVYRWQD